MLRQRKKKKDEKLTKRVTKQGSYSESVEETEPIDGADLDVEEIEKAPRKPDWMRKQNQ